MFIRTIRLVVVPRFVIIMHVFYYLLVYTRVVVYECMYYQIGSFFHSIFFFFFGIVSDFASDACLYVYLYVDSVPKRIEFPSLTTMIIARRVLSLLVLPAAENGKKNLRIPIYRPLRRRRRRYRMTRWQERIRQGVVGSDGGMNIQLPPPRMLFPTPHAILGCYY